MSDAPYFVRTELSRGTPEENYAAFMEKYHSVESIWCSKLQALISQSGKMKKEIAKQANIEVSILSRITKAGNWWIGVTALRKILEVVEVGLGLQEFLFNEKKSILIPKYLSVAVNAYQSLDKDRQKEWKNKALELLSSSETATRSLPLNSLFRERLEEIAEEKDTIVYRLLSPLADSISAFELQEIGRALKKDKDIHMQSLVRLAYNLDISLDYLTMPDYTTSPVKYKNQKTGKINNVPAGSLAFLRLLLELGKDERSRIIAEICAETVLS